MKKRTIRNCKVTVSKKSEIKYDETFMSLVLRGLRDFYVSHNKSQYISRKDLLNYVKKWYIVDKNNTCRRVTHKSKDCLIDHALDLCISRLRHSGCLIDKDGTSRDGLYKINNNIKTFLDIADKNAVDIIMNSFSNKKISENKENVPVKYLSTCNKARKITILRNGIAIATSYVKASMIDGHY